MQLGEPKTEPGQKKGFTSSSLSQLWIRMKTRKANLTNS